MDFTFYRWLAVCDANGEVVIDPRTGEPLRRRELISLRPDAGHKEPLPCVGRPVEIGDTFSTLTVGYNESGGFFGPDVKFKPREGYLAELQKGDIVVLTPRPPDAK